jgi:hypothetical protein
MRITALASIAIAMSILAAQPATADPERRNHPIKKSQQNQKDRVQPVVKSDASGMRAPVVKARKQIDGVSKEKPDGQQR